MRLLEYKKHLTFALRLTKNKQQAEDAVHSAWIAAKEKGRHEDGAFITGCIKNCFLFTLRSNRITSSYSDSIGPVLDGTTTVTFTQLDVSKLAACLKPRQQSLLLAVYLNADATHAELAKLTGDGRRNTSYHMGQLREALKEAV